MNFTASILLTFSKNLYHSFKINVADRARAFSACRVWPLFTPDKLFLMICRSHRRGLTIILIRSITGTLFLFPVFKRSDYISMAVYPADFVVILKNIHSPECTVPFRTCFRRPTK